MPGRGIVAVTRDHARRGAAAPVTIGIVAGEASGDALAATLIHAVRARHPGVRFAGIAGPKMQAAGCEAWFPLEKLAVRGFVEVLAHLPELVAHPPRSCARGCCDARVPLFVGVDAPGLQPRTRAQAQARAACARCTS